MYSFSSAEHSDFPPASVLNRTLPTAHIACLHSSHVRFSHESPVSAAWHDNLCTAFVYMNVTRCLFGCCVWSLLALDPSRVSHGPDAQPRLHRGELSPVSSHFGESEARAGSGLGRWRSWLVEWPAWSGWAGCQAKRKVLICRLRLSSSLSQLEMSGRKETNMKHFFKGNAYPSHEFILSLDFSWKRRGQKCSLFLAGHVIAFWRVFHFEKNKTVQREPPKSSRFVFITFKFGSFFETSDRPERCLCSAVLTPVPWRNHMAALFNTLLTLHIHLSAVFLMIFQGAVVCELWLCSPLPQTRSAKFPHSPSRL